MTDKFTRPKLFDVRQEKLCIKLENILLKSEDVEEFENRGKKIIINAENKYIETDFAFQLFIDVLLDYSNSKEELKKIKINT